MDRVVANYLESTKDDAGTRTTEFEVRFKSQMNPTGNLSKTDYDNVLNRLVSSGFKTEQTDGAHALRITTLENKRQVRTEIDDFKDIEHYCRTNKLNENATFSTKTPVKDGKTTVADFAFSLNVSVEDKAPDDVVASIQQKWDTLKKTFRYMNRIKLVHPDYPVSVDCSIVRSSNFDKGSMIPATTIQEAGALTNNESYEIEIEIINSKITPSLKTHLSTCIQLVLCGIQNTNYPISTSTRTKVLADYFELIKTNVPQKIKSTNFIGPNSVTLQLKDLPFISHDYSVTDKADGLRKLLFINAEGHLYFITSSMEIEYTNQHCKIPSCHNTLIDGEHITVDDKGQPINLYGCFDLYFNHTVDCRPEVFIGPPGSRLEQLQKVVRKMGDLKNSMVVSVKKFAHTDKSTTIQQACAFIFGEQRRYHTDGLIFTPMNYGVGLSSKIKEVQNSKITWALSFKWKPPDQNTIDFLVVTLKNKKKDVIANEFDLGENTTGTPLPPYKTLLLHVGSKTMLNPCKSALKKQYERRGYNPVKFKPSNPSDDHAHLCYCLLQDGQLRTKEGEVFGDEMVVEFSYNTKTKEPGWNWEPLRVRWDKTSDYLKAKSNFGNDYDTANNNWQSIHNPIDQAFLTGDSFEQVESDAYYLENVGEKKTKAMCNFHNYIKRSLIKAVAQPGNTLVDFAVGKAGDLRKWAAAQLSFVLGIDDSKDCIENTTDGACLRYLEYKKDHPDELVALFLHGDSSHNVRSGEFVKNNPKDKALIASIFGLDKAEYHNKAVDGFDVSSAQFSLHYFFKNMETLTGFIRNVSECTKDGGFFIGTCFDGHTIFNLPHARELFGVGDDRICEIQKMYSQTSFPDDETSLGYPIQVYNQSIGKFITEYLVNFKFFTALMSLHGFEPHAPHDLWTTSPSNTFDAVFDYINVPRISLKIKKHLGDSLNMTPEEKRLSFMNRYFIFKKCRPLDSGKPTVKTT